jgi:thiaminase/transcriptional activator TenA
MAEPSLSQRLLAANRGVWDEMQAHRFVRDIEADALPRPVFARYVAHEHGFVETAILIFGYAMLKAPDFTARRWLCGVLYALSGEQLGYFDRVFAALGTGPSRPGAAPPSVAAFGGFMLGVAESGSYLDILTVMLAAEWMYATWCARAAQRPISDPDIAEWVQMHAAPEFRAQADWLRAGVDAGGLDIDAAALRRLSDLFGTALRLEVDFHAAPYEAAPA